MQTITINIYSFNELDELAKKRAIEQSRYVNTEHDWYSLIFAEWEQKLNDIGFMEVDLFFRITYSQGDGACFDSSHIDLEKVVRHIKRYTEYKSLFYHLANDTQLRLELTPSIEQNGYSTHYCHEKTRFFDLDWEYIGCFWRGEEDLDDIIDRLREEVEALRLHLCKQFYQELQSAYEYLISDKAVIDSILSNEWLFESDGTLSNH